MKLASGAAPVNAMMNEGVRLGLGTDGAASNNDLDMFEEMATAALLGKHSTGDPKATPAAKVLEMATLGGARAIGMEDRFGSLETGKRADVMIVGIDAFRMHPLFDPVSHLVYAAKGADVRHVIIDGRVVMRDRKVLTLDADAVVAEADRMRQQVVRTLERTQPVKRRPAPLPKAPPSAFGVLPTEQRNPRSTGLDTMSAQAIVKLLLEEDRRALSAALRQVAPLARAADAFAAAFAGGGSVLFAGAGTSGRLGVLEAAECPPTFGVDPERVRASMAGGERAVFRAVEGAEDDFESGQREGRTLQARRPADRASPRVR